MASSRQSSNFPLPQELRDMIYRELLTPAIGNQKRKSYGLDTAVLFVNGQVHKEASRVLYAENCWVLLTTSWCISDQIEHYHAISGAPVLVLNHGKSSFGGKYAMQIDISRNYLKTGKGPKNGSWIVAAVHDLQRTFSALLPMSGASGLVLDVGIHKSYYKHPHHQKRMLETLRDVREALEPRILGLQPAPLARELVSQMAKRRKVLREGIERLHAYQLRGDAMVAQRDFLEASIIYSDGLYLREWDYDLDLLEYDETDLLVFRNQVSALYTACAFCDLQTGNAEQAHTDLIEVLDRRDLPIEMEAKASYYLGLSYLARRSYNHAAFCFLQALIHHPGHADVDGEVDLLEVKVNDMATDMVDEHGEDRRSLVLRNFRNVLGLFRHKTAMDSVMDLAEVKELSRRHIKPYPVENSAEADAEKFLWADIPGHPTAEG